MDMFYILCIVAASTHLVNSRKRPPEPKPIRESIRSTGSLSNSKFNFISNNDDAFNDESSRRQNQVIESFHVRSDIRYRFATTQITSLVRNSHSDAREVGFDIALPEEAFIVDFYMTIGGKRYNGEIKERKEAEKDYQHAVDQGWSAGHVKQTPRYANVFEVSVNVAAGEAVNFSLSYQEILRRRNRFYEHGIHVHPGQVVDDFRVEVLIRENRPLRFVRTPALKTDDLLTSALDGGANTLTVIERPSPETAMIVFEPSAAQQGDEGKGLDARFTIQYDVEHSGIGGDILVVDGYFVHFVVPDELLDTFPKDIIFVLDTSSSMAGTKIYQLKDAMETILSDLQPQDRFNILTFDYKVKNWRANLVQADERQISTAKSYVSTIRARGGTNINDALLSAVRSLNSRENMRRVAMIFFLTDGQPSSGERDLNIITRNILNKNEGTAAIFSLAFGKGADYDWLKTLSAKNLGFARKIYEASDADLQVSSLYNEISAVSVKNMQIKYQTSTVDEFSVTQTDFPLVFNGTEIMVCGMLEAGKQELHYEITGLTNSGIVDLEIEVDTFQMQIDDGNARNSHNNTSIFTGPRDFSSIVEKMWAYTTIKQLLSDKEKYADNVAKVAKIETKVLEMSLKYKFVTPLTSLVVVKPDQGMTRLSDPAGEKIPDEEIHFKSPAMGGPTKAIMNMNSASLDVYDLPTDEDESEEADKNSSHKIPDQKLRCLHVLGLLLCLVVWRCRYKM